MRVSSTETFPAGSGHPPRLALIIPAYNEEHRIGGTLTKCLEYFSRQDYTCDIVVVDDGSTDSTAAQVRDRFDGVRVLRYESNRGKGYAVKYGMMHSNAEICLLYDADGATPIEEVEYLWPEFEAGAHVVIGSRRAAGAKIEVEQPPARIAMGRIYNVVLRCLRLTDFSDTQCGFKAFNADARRQIFPLQRNEGFSFDIEILYLARRLSLTVVEIPVRWYDSADSRVRPAADALRMLRDAFLLRFRTMVPTADLPRP